MYVSGYFNMNVYFTNMITTKNLEHCRIQVTTTQITQILFIQFGSNRSEIKSINDGVPQGSIL